MYDSCSLRFALAPQSKRTCSKRTFSVVCHAHYGKLRILSSVAHTFYSATAQPYVYGSCFVRAGARDFLRVRRSLAMLNICGGYVCGVWNFFATYSALGYTKGNHLRRVPVECRRPSVSLGNRRFGVVFPAPLPPSPEHTPTCTNFPTCKKKLSGLWSVVQLCATAP